MSNAICKNFLFWDYEGVIHLRTQPLNRKLNETRPCFSWQVQMVTELLFGGFTHPHSLLITVPVTVTLVGSAMLVYKGLGSQKVFMLAED